MEKQEAINYLNNLQKGMFCTVNLPLYGDEVIPITVMYIGKDKDGNDIDKTVISREYSSEWKPGDEPYYPVNDEKNGALYAEYKKLAEKEEKVIRKNQKK